MRFESITIENYRQHQSLHLDFSRVGNKDLHVLIAKNGVGKTTLLNAINWCLYADEPHLGIKSAALPLANTASIREAKAAGESDVRVRVEIRASDGSKNLIFKRIATCRILNESMVDDPVTQLTVIVQDTSSSSDSRSVTGGEATKIVNSYLPESIREYFFFDGEQLNSYFLSESDGRVKSAVHDISQVDVVTRSAKHLKAFIGAKEEEAGRRAPKVNVIKSEVDQLERALESKEEERAGIEAAIAYAEAQAEVLNEKLRGFEHVPELNDRWNELRAEKEREKTALGIAQKELIKYLHHARVALNFTPVARAVLSAIRDKRENSQLPPKVDRDMLTEMLHKHICEICGQPLTEAAEEDIRVLLDMIMVSSKTSHTLVGIEHALETVVKDAANYPAERDRYMKRVSDAQARLDAVEVELATVDKDLQKYDSNREIIAAHHNARKEQLRIAREKREDLGQIKAVIEGLTKQYEKKKSDLEKALKKEESCKDLRQEIEFLQECYGIVCAVERKMMDDVRVTMEQSTTDYFNEFIWKRDTYSHVELSEDYQVELIHKDGYSCLGSCSAGERALLAMAFTLALHKVSGFNAPLIIDTPLARISDDNRVNFAEMFSKVSSGKEIIMTLTPNEYSEEISTEFEPSMASQTEVYMEEGDEEHSYIRRLK